VEPQDDGAALSRIRNLVIGRKAALQSRWERFGCFENPLNRLCIRPSARTSIADRGKLMGTQRWVLNLEVDDHLAKFWWKCLE